jgi:hypothetical protein
MTDGSANPWRAILHQRMRGQPTPMLVMPDAIWSAASLWAGTRAWVAAFRTSGLVAGDRLIIALPEGPAFVQVLLACLWDDITMVVTNPGGDLDSPVRALGALGIVATVAATVPDGCGHFVPDAASQPPHHVVPLRTARDPAVPVAALGNGRDVTGVGATWMEWSAQALFGGVNAHPARASLAGARVLSVLSWTQPSGMIAGLLLPLLEADEIVRDLSAGRDPGSIAAATREHGITHLDADLDRLRVR